MWFTWLVSLNVRYMKEQKRSVILEDSVMRVRETVTEPQQGAQDQCEFQFVSIFTPDKRDTKTRFTALKNL